MRLFFFLTNLFKIVLWIAIIPVCVHYFGTLYGTLIFVAAAFLRNLHSTFVGDYRKNEDEWRVLKIIFSTDFWLPFTVYGNYCSPHYGGDGRTKGLDPIDGLDEVCMYHDADMEYAKLPEHKDEIKKLKNAGDWNFMKHAIVSDNNANGVYLLGLEIGFLFRIISRTLVK